MSTLFLLSVLCVYNTVQQDFVCNPPQLTQFVSGDYSNQLRLVTGTAKRIFKVTSTASETGGPINFDPYNFFPVGPTGNLTCQTALSCSHNFPNNAGETQMWIDADLKLHIDPISSMRTSATITCNNFNFTFSYTFTLLIQPECQHFYDNAIEPILIQNRSEPHKLTPTDEFRVSLTSIYATGSTECPTNFCDLYEPDCTTIIDPATSTYFVTDPDQSQNIYIMGDPHLREIWSKNDRLYNHQFCIKCTDVIGQVVQYQRIFEIVCKNDGGVDFYDQFILNHPDKTTQTVLVNQMSSTYNYVTPETGQIQDSYFQIYGEFPNNIGLNGDPCAISYSFYDLGGLTAPVSQKFTSLTKVSDTDWRVYIDPLWQKTVGPHQFEIRISQGPPDNSLKILGVSITPSPPGLSNPNPFRSVPLTLYIICEPIDTFKENPGGIHQPLGPVVGISGIFLTMFTLQYQAWQPPVTINEWDIDSDRLSGPTACFVTNTIYDLDKISPLTFPSGINVLSTTNQFEFFLNSADNSKHGVYEFYMLVSMNNVNNPDSKIWTDMITMRIGCGFRVLNNNYRPFIESQIELLDPNFDSSVWSYVDYSLFPPLTVATALPVVDLATYLEGGHIFESKISCGVAGATQCLWPVSFQVPDYMKIVKNNYTPNHVYDFNCQQNFKAVTNEDIANPILSNDIQLSIVSTSLQIDFTCPLETLYTFKILIELPQTLIKPSLQAEYNEYFFTKDFTIKCNCHYPEQVEWVYDSLLTHTVYIGQSESTDFTFKISDIACKRQFCKLSEVCQWQACSTPCKQFFDLKLVDTDKTTSFGSMSPGEIDETQLQTGILTIQKTKIRYYRVHILKETAEDPQLMTNVGSGPIKVQGVLISPQIYIKVICGPIEYDNTNFKIPELNVDQDPFRVPFADYSTIFKLPAGRYCPDKMQYGLSYNQDCSSTLNQVDQNAFYFDYGDFFIRRDMPMLNKRLYICAFYPHVDSTQLSYGINITIKGCATQFIENKSTQPGIPIIKAHFIRGSTYTGKGGAIQVVPFNQFEHFFKSSSPEACPINQYYLVWRPKDQQFYEHLPFKYGAMDQRTNDILIVTTKLIDQYNQVDLHKFTYVAYQIGGTNLIEYARLDLKIFDVPSWFTFNKTSFDMKYLNITEEETGRQQEEILWVEQLNGTWAPKYPKNQNITCRIRSINEKGIVRIEFSKLMVDQSQGFNISLINNETLRFSIIPSQETLSKIKAKEPEAVFDEYSQIISSEYLNYTWYPINNSFSQTQLLLQVNFNYSLNFSQDSNYRDKFNITILDKFLFRGARAEFLQNFTMIQHIRKQYMDDEWSNIMEDFTDKFVLALRAISVFNIIISILLAISLQPLAQAFQNIQIVLMCTMINIIFPGNAMYLIRSLNLILQAEIVDPEWTTKLVFDLSFDNELIRRLSLDLKAKHLLNQHLQDMDYETFCFILNVAGILLIFVLYILQLVILYSLFLLTKLVKKKWPKFHEESRQKIFQTRKYQKLKIKKILKEIKEEKLQKEGGNKEEAEVPVKVSNCRSRLLKVYHYLHFSQKKLARRIIMGTYFFIMIESMPQLFISIVLQLNKTNLKEQYFEEDEMEKDITQNVLAYFFLVLMFLTLLIFVDMILVETEFLKEKEVIHTFGDIIGRLNKDNKYQAAYNLVFCFRRLIYATVVLFLTNETWLQIQLFLYFNLASLIFISNSKPLTGRVLTRNENFGELLTCLIMILSLWFTDFCLYPETKYIFGYCFNVVLISTCCFFYAYVLIDIWKNIRPYFMREYLKIKRKIDKMIQVRKLKEKINTKIGEGITNILKIHSSNQNQNQSPENIKESSEQVKNDKDNDSDVFSVNIQHNLIDFDDNKEKKERLQQLLILQQTSFQNERNSVMDSLRKQLIEEKISIDEVIRQESGIYELEKCRLFYEFNAYQHCRNYFEKEFIVDKYQENIDHEDDAWNFGENLQELRNEFMEKKLEEILFGKYNFNKQVQIQAHILYRINFIKHLDRPFKPIKNHFAKIEYDKNLIEEFLTEEQFESIQQILGTDLNYSEMRNIINHYNLDTLLLRNYPNIDEILDFLEEYYKQKMQISPIDKKSQKFEEQLMQKLSAFFPTNTLIKQN